MGGPGVRVPPCWPHDLALAGQDPSRLIDTAQKAASALEKQFAIYRHRFERASAAELTRLLPEDLPDSLRTELEELVDARNELAHRYLQRTLEGATRADLKKELQATQALGQRFVDASDVLRKLTEDAVGDRPPNVSDAQFAALQRLGRAAS